MLTLEQIKIALEDRNLTVVAKKIDLHPNTLRNLKNGVYQPSYQVLEKLSNYLETPIDDR